jgi:hypothetical protein
MALIGKRHLRVCKLSPTAGVEAMAPPTVAVCRMLEELVA